MVPPGEGNEARGEGRRGVGVSHSTAEAGELSPRDPVEGRGHRQVAPVEGKTANTPRLGPVSTSRQRIAELARQALGMAVAIAWLPGPAGTRRRVAKPSVEEPDAAEPARPDLWGARVSNDPGLPDPADTVNRESRRCSRPALLVAYLFELVLGELPQNVPRHFAGEDVAVLVDHDPLRDDRFDA